MTDDAELGRNVFLRNEHEARLPKGNRADGIERLRHHVNETKGARSCDLTDLAPSGTLLAPHREDGFLQEPTLSPDAWADVGSGGYRLLHAHDTTQGPECAPVQPGRTRLRLCEMRTVQAPTADGRVNAAAAMLLVERYGDTVSEAAAAVMSSYRLIDPDGARAHSERAEDVTFVNPVSGPQWPTPEDWTQRASDQYTPNRRLLWKGESGTSFVIVCVILAEREVSVHVREVQPAQWVCIPTCDEGLVMPSVEQLRASAARRSSAELHAVLMCKPLLPDSYKETFNWLFNGHIHDTRKPRGGNYVHKNLNAQMNFYAGFLNTLEYGFDILRFHPQAWKLRMSFLHVAKHADPGVNILHTLVLGPPGLGKSHLCDLLVKFTPPGLVSQQAHATPQRLSVPAPHTGWATGVVVVRDEQSAAQLGLDGTGKDNSSTESSQYKQFLTNQVLKSEVFQSAKDGTRSNVKIETETQMPQVQLSNHYLHSRHVLAPAMLSRFNVVQCYLVDRPDIARAKARVMGEDRQAFSELWANQRKGEAALQLIFDTMQALGFVAPVPTEGWLIVKSEFEQKLKDWPFVDITAMDRMLGHAFEYVRMMANNHAIHLTFGHPLAERRDLSKFTLGDMHIVERYITPSDELMYLALSMLEEDIFPHVEIVVLRCLLRMVREGLADNTEMTNLLTFKEMDLDKYKAAVLARIEGKTVPPYVWAGKEEAHRSYAAQFLRIKQLLPGEEDMLPAPCGEANSMGLPAPNSLSKLDTVCRKLAYVSAFEATSKSRDDFIGKVAKQVKLQPEAIGVPTEHIEEALKCLLERTVGNQELAIIEVVNQVQKSNQAPEHRYVIHKEALDKIEKLSVKAVLQRMTHSFSRPGTYLVNQPCKTKEGKCLPQLADFITIPLHGPDCGARHRGMALGEAAEEVLRRAEEEGVAPPTETRFWFGAAAQRVGCNCARSGELKTAAGVIMPKGVSEVMKLQLGGDLESVGLEYTPAVALSSTADWVAYRAHIKRITGLDVDTATQAQRERFPWLDKANPATRKWHSKELSNDMYPEGLAAHYVPVAEPGLEEVAQQQGEPGHEEAVQP